MLNEKIIIAVYFFFVYYLSLLFQEKIARGVFFLFQDGWRLRHTDSMTNVDGSGTRVKTAVGHAARTLGRWSDTLLGITWKDVRRAVFKPTQSDDGLRQVVTVERLYQGSPASNSKIIRAGDKLMSIDVVSRSVMGIGCRVKDVAALMEQVGEKQDIKLEFLRATDTFPFASSFAPRIKTLAELPRSRNTYTITLTAVPKKADAGRTVEVMAGTGGGAGGSSQQPGGRGSSRDGSRGGVSGKRASRIGGGAAAAAPLPPLPTAADVLVARPPSTGRPASRPGSCGSRGGMSRFGARPKTTSWVIRS